MSNDSVADRVEDVLGAFFSTGAHKHKVHTLIFKDDQVFNERQIFRIVDAVPNVEGVHVDEAQHKVHFVLDGSISPVSQALKKEGYAFSAVE